MDIAPTKEKQMNKTLIGIVSFGNIEFTKLTINSIKETTKNEIDFFVVVGKPGDTATEEWLESEKISHIVHEQNWGFPISVNDIYDFAWKIKDYDNLIIVGNDIVAYPYCIDSLINLANESDYEMISALQVDARALRKEYPELEKYLIGVNGIFTDFTAKPWEVFKNYSPEYQIADMQLFDIQNCGLYKKSVFDKIGYTDVNFYPAYYIDNDYARRIVNSGMKCCTLVSARFFHFWSRTIHQETGGSTHGYFDNNRRYYIKKWGNDFGKELWKTPFNGMNYNLYRDIMLPASIKISDRDNEERIISFWRDVMPRRC
jgi:GT2 family glycosyltransferase